MRLLFPRVKLAFFAVAATGACLGGLTSFASAASAANNASVTAYGGPQEVYVTGSGYSANDHVRVTVLTGDGRYDLGQECTGSPATSSCWGVNVNNGNLTAEFFNLGYTGPVQVWVDDFTTDTTQYAQATTTAELQWTLDGGGGCGNVATAEADNFLPGYSARFELLTQNLSVIANYTTATVNGSANAGSHLWPGSYQGWAYLVVDEVGLVHGIPAPAEIWDHVWVC